VLSNRTLQVRINNTCSDIYIVQNGTPQGSCISLTLFNIMVNDLSSCIKNCEMSQFADDGAIWKSGPNLKHLQNKIQQDLDNISSLEEYHFELYIYLNKCYLFLLVMFYCSKNHLHMTKL
jgi:hypothetical protein